MDPREARRELLDLVHTNPAPFPFDEAAWLLAADEYPALDPEPYRERLEEYARATRVLVADSRDPRVRLGALRRVLFEDGGLHGNRADYYDVRNSYLHEVLDRKLGIPISLAIVLLAVARRLGWRLDPVNFPDHFLLRYSAGEEVLAVDAFHGGLILGSEDLAELWIVATRTPAPPDLSLLLQPAAPSVVLVRMLNNIRFVHVARRRFREAALATEKVLLLEPHVPMHERDLGYLWLAAREREKAILHLERYLARAPEAGDAAPIRRRVEELREARSPEE